MRLRVEYFSRGRPLGWLELARNPPPNESTTAPPPDVVYARSEFTLGWMKMPGDASALVNEGESMVGRP